VSSGHGEWEQSFFLGDDPLVEAQAWSSAVGLRDKFATDTGIAATGNFGAWVMQPVGGTLFIGAGNSPGNEDGAAVLSSADGVTIVSGRVLNEQGVHDAHVQGSDLWVCGTDPSDDWTLGNLYHRDAGGAWTKLRTLPLTIHALGCWHDGAALWVCGGMHTGDSATWKGRILKSLDSGATWSTVDVNNYRLYDVIGFDGKLYVVGHDFTGVYSQDLHSSVDGVAWSKVAGVSPAIKARLALHGTLLVGVQSSLAGLFTVSAGGAVTLRATSFTLADHWNVLDSDGVYLYALDVTGGVWRTTDFVTWTLYARVAGAISIKWWAGHGLMIGDMGTAARVWLA